MNAAPLPSTASPAPRNPARARGPLVFTFELAPEQIDAIAERAADLLAARWASAASPWLSTEQAADYLAAKGLLE
jgi:hypothetical protein